ncbi:hypothetical protein K474DRAFT_819335 [Panus rudis PR-1116 ss-1]|nr:hypothetical protein K474DRAFT_819335 [Panus rudis PR-1116 ss-1]
MHPIRTRRRRRSVSLICSLNSISLCSLFFLFSLSLLLFSLDLGFLFWAIRCAWILPTYPLFSLGQGIVWSFFTLQVSSIKFFRALSQLHPGPLVPPSVRNCLLAWPTRFHTCCLSFFLLGLRSSDFFDMDRQTTPDHNHPPFFWTDFWYTKSSPEDSFRSIATYILFLTAHGVCEGVVMGEQYGLNMC